MKIYRNCLIAAVLAFLAVDLQAAASAPTAESLYQEAVFQETTARDLAAAIVLYRKTLEHPDAGRALQGPAYLRLGICYRTLGQNNQAKESWTHVLEEFADQTAAYQEARTRLQELSVSEEKTASVQSSTPTVVYAIPRTRGELRLPGLGYSSANVFFLAYPSLAYFYRSERAIGIEGAMMDGDGDEDFNLNGSFDVNYFAITHQWEKALGNQLHPYFKAGPAIYQFQATDYRTSQEEEKWSGGLLAEAGVTIGWSRGFVFTLGYGLNAFYQPRLLSIVGSSIRGIHGARFSLGYRW
jgi:hypothetical protein